MKLGEMDEERRRNVGTAAAALVQAEHLQASGDGEKEDCRREKDANVIVGRAYGFQAGSGSHLVAGLTPNLEVSQSTTSETENPSLPHK